MNQIFQRFVSRKKVGNVIFEYLRGSFIDLKWSHIHTHTHKSSLRSLDQRQFQEFEGTWPVPREMVVTGSVIGFRLSPPFLYSLLLFLSLRFVCVFKFCPLNLIVLCRETNAEFTQYVDCQCLSVFYQIMTYWHYIFVIIVLRSPTRLLFYINYYKIKCTFTEVYNTFKLWIWSFFVSSLPLKTVVPLHKICVKTDSHCLIMIDYDYK